MKLLYAYIHTAALVMRDFYIFGQYTWETIAIYTRATREVVSELYRELIPATPKSETRQSSVFDTIDTDDVTQLIKLTAIIFAVCSLIVLWLLFLLISVGR